MASRERMRVAQILSRTSPGLDRFIRFKFTWGIDWEHGWRGLADRRARAAAVLELLRDAYPDAPTELKYRNTFELPDRDDPLGSGHRQKCQPGLAHSVPNLPGCPYPGIS